MNRPDQAPVIPNTRFARGVERRSFKKAVALLRRSDGYLKKAEDLATLWHTRLEARKGRSAPERLQDVAQRIGTILHKARLLLLSGSHRLNPMLTVLGNVENELLELGSGVCVGGLFGHALDQRLSKKEAVAGFEQIIIGVKNCRVCADRLRKDLNKRLLELEAVKTPSVKREDTKFQHDTTDQFSSFLDQLKNRGWKVTDTKKEEEEPTVDLMAKSHDTVKKISGTQESLLPDDVEVGVCKVPIVLIKETRLSDSVKRAFTDNNLELLTVYGNYTAINGLYLLGIHRRIMAIDAREIDQKVKGAVPESDPYRNIPAKNGKKLDVVKFNALLPAVISEDPELEELLSDTIPLGNPVKAGTHYYMPLLPKILGRLQSFSLGEWQPLLSKSTPI